MYEVCVCFEPEDYLADDYVLRSFITTARDKSLLAHSCQTELKGIYSIVPMMLHFVLLKGAYVFGKIQF